MRTQRLAAVSMLAAVLGAGCVMEPMRPREVARTGLESIESTGLTASGYLVSVSGFPGVRDTVVGPFSGPPDSEIVLAANLPEVRSEQVYENVIPRSGRNLWN